MNLIKYSLNLLIILHFISAARADLIFSAPPRETVQQGLSLYEPLVNAISSIVHQKVTYEPPSNWFEYGIKMRSGAYDIVFDGPHFAAWRIKRLQHTPIVALPGELRFVLFTNKDNKLINNLSDLSENILCGIRLPNLGTSLIMSEYSNPDKQPMLYEVSGDTLRNIYANFNEGVCHAAVMQDQAYFDMTRNNTSSYKVLFTTVALPHQTITISPNVKKYADELSRFLTSSAGARTAAKLLRRYSRDNPKFINTDIGLYFGMDRILKGVVSGW
ncbi:MAG: phosphate/phosphite/phosphonate ABC transporter substrate-binding protein [Thiohalomonadales bacterium]